MNKIYIRIKGQETLIDLDETGIQVICQVDNKDACVFDLGSFLDENIDWEELECQE